MEQNICQQVKNLINPSLHPIHHFLESFQRTYSFFCLTNDNQIRIKTCWTTWTPSMYLPVLKWVSLMWQKYHTDTCWGDHKQSGLFKSILNKEKHGNTYLGIASHKTMWDIYACKRFVYITTVIFMGYFFVFVNLDTQFDPQTNLIRP